VSCRRYDELLALHVEGDLDPAEAAPIEEHLAACERCRGFLRELQVSQGALKTLGARDVGERPLAAVRAAVQTQLARRQHRGAWRWAALAASLLVAALIAYRVTLPGPTQEARALASPPAPAPAPARTEAAAGLRLDPPPVARSTPRRDARVSVHEGHAPAYGLSDEDADQLARALLAVAEFERAKAERETRRDPPSPPLVRIVTADPDVVIYWQLDSTGG
jgi:Putative zinc-finger